MERVVTKEELGTYVAPPGKSLILKVGGAEEKYVEVDTVSLQLPENIRLAPVVTFKADLFRRMTDAEVTTFEGLMGQQPKRKQKIFDHAQYLDHSDPDFQQLRVEMEKAFGPARTAELLR